MEPELHFLPSTSLHGYSIAWIIYMLYILKVIVKLPVFSFCLDLCLMNPRQNLFDHKMNISSDAPLFIFYKITLLWHGATTSAISSSEIEKNQ